MVLGVSKRVHIAPLGYEVDRVIEPTQRYDADLVYLLEHVEPNDVAEEFSARIIDEIESTGITVETRKCDIFDLYGVIGTISEVASHHTDDDIFVNVSTGSKISAIGGMIASMVNQDRATISAYYVRPKEYFQVGDEKESPYPPEVASDAIMELPRYPIEGPEPAEIAVLKYISQSGPTSKKNLIKHARQQIDRFERNREEKGIAVDNKPEIGEYRLLDTHILEPLLERRCIEISEKGRSKHVSITDEGEKTLRAFSHLVE